MANILIKNDISIFDGRLNDIKSALLLLEVLSYLRDKNNVVNITREELLKALTENGRAPCDRVVRYWRRNLEYNGAIKYCKSKYIINPLYVFDGTREAWIRTIAYWNNFPATYEPKYSAQIAV